jgi:hypothetical protein
MTFRRTTIALILVSAVAAAGVGGCKAKSVIQSVWPTASAERTVPKPPAPPRWPLTGLDAPDQQATLIRPISVKIENSAPSRPQSGLDMADVVYETVTEGGITRFNAIFQSKQPKVAGPVRSVRYSDLYIVPQYHAIFAHCGGESNLQKALEHPRYGDMDQFFNSAPYFRSSEKAAPHNLFVDLAKLRDGGVPGVRLRPLLARAHPGRHGGDGALRHGQQGDVGLLGEHEDVCTLDQRQGPQGQGIGSAVHRAQRRRDVGPGEHARPSRLGRNGRARDRS